jgi:hypothetical protein
MPTLAYRHREADSAAWAQELGISREAVELYLASEVMGLASTVRWTCPGCARLA